MTTHERKELRRPLTYFTKEKRKDMLKIIHSSCRRFSSGAAKKSLVKSEVIKVDEIGVGVITLSNPSHLNALTVEMGEEFKDHVKQMRDHARNQNIRACIVTGDGDAFSAGGDLNWLRERHSTSAYLNSLIMLDFYNRFLCIRDIHVPTIAAINGAAIGAGLCMTLACDIRVVSDSAKLGFTFPKLGIHPGMGASVLLPRIVRQEVASHLLMSGDVFSGSDAKDYGLVLKSVSKVISLISIFPFVYSRLMLYDVLGRRHGYCS